ncbi:MAG: serine protease [Burkholderiales bacterium]
MPRKTKSSSTPVEPSPPVREQDRQRARAQALLKTLRSAPNAKAVNEARALVLQLRNLRDFELMGRLAEALCRIDPADARTRRLYAQGLIETGSATAAIDMLRQLLAMLPKQHEEAVEAWGLLGRAYKQIFFDAADASSTGARLALTAAVEAYRQPYKAEPKKNTWHGVNLLALVSRARREGWSEIAPRLDTAKLAAELLANLRAMPAKARDEWYLPTLAEVTLGLGLSTGDLRPVESLLREYLGAKDVQAFQVASTLRQFIEVWGLEQLTTRTRGVALQGAAGVQRARGLVDVLRARLLQLPGGELALPALQVSLPRPAIGRGAAGRARAAAPRAVPTDNSQLEAILGVEGPQTFAWWRAGVEAARSVAVVRQRLGKRLGSGFLVRAGDFGLLPADELLLLTNFHVINAKGSAPGIRPEEAEVVFEADDPGKAYAVQSLVWTSPVDQHDASLLRLQSLPSGIPALPVSSLLPNLPGAEVTKRPRVYIIGYPGGRELSFSFQDNELLDHEGPSAGQPQIPGVVRVHYHAPTEGGNSGSPVFEDSGWKVIALHHKGGKFGMPRLNGQPGTYAANEGLALATLVAAVKATAG